MQTIIAHPNFEYLADEIVKLNPNTKKAKVKFSYDKLYENDFELSVSGYWN